MSFRATTEQLQPEALSVMVFQMVYAIMRWHHLNLHVHDCMGAWPMLVPPMNYLDDTYQQNVQQQISDATFNSKYQVSPMPSIQYNDCGIRKSLADSL